MWIWFVCKDVWERKIKQQDDQNKHLSSICPSISLNIFLPGWPKKESEKIRNQSDIEKGPDSLFC